MKHTRHVCRHVNAQHVSGVSALRLATDPALTPDLLLPQVVDVSSLSSIATFTRDFVATGQPLHLLVNNAGVLVRWL
jgi:NAD(P)-dependent dehydrogenase (short-subunit alcohol dehydrogenase family)